MLSTGLFNLIKNDSGVQAIVGTVATRSDRVPGIFPVLAPKECTTPYVVYSQHSGDPIKSMDGANKTQFAVYTIMCCAADYPMLKKLSKAIKALLDGYTGTLSEGTLVESSFCFDRGDDIEPQLKGTLYKSRIDVELTFADIGA